MDELLKSLDHEEDDQPSATDNSTSAGAGEDTMDESKLSSRAEELPRRVYEVAGDALPGNAPASVRHVDLDAAQPLRSWREKKADAMRALHALAQWQSEQAGPADMPSVAREGAEDEKDLPWHQIMAQKHHQHVTKMMEEQQGSAAEQAFRESVQQAAAESKANVEKQARKRKKKKGFLIIGEDDEEIQQVSAPATDRGRRRGGAFSRIAGPVDRPEAAAPVSSEKREDAAEPEADRPIPMAVPAVSPEDTLHITARAAVTGEKIVKLTLQGSALVQDLREAIQQSWQADGVLQISYEEVALDDDWRLCDTGLCDHATVFVDRMPPLYVLTTSADHTARIWRTAKDGKYAELRGHDLQVQQGSFAATDVRVVTASVDGTARVWSSITGLCEWTLRGHEGQVLTAVFSRDGEFVLTASTDKTARIWKVEDGSCLLQLQGHRGAVNMARFSPNDAQVVTASADETLRLWRSDTGECIRTYTGHQSGVFKVLFSPNGAWLLSTCIDGPPRVLSNFNADATPLEGHFGGALHGNFSPDSAQVVTGGHDGHVRLWSTHTGKPLQTLKGHTSQITCVVFSPNGASVVSSAADSTARIWEAASGRCIRILRGHADAVSQVTLSHDGWMLVTGSVDGTARVWSTESGRCSQVLKGHRSAVISVEFSHM